MGYAVPGRFELPTSASVVRRAIRTAPRNRDGTSHAHPWVLRPVPLSPRPSPGRRRETLCSHQVLGCGSQNIGVIAKVTDAHVAGPAQKTADALAARFSRFRAAFMVVVHGQCSARRIWTPANCAGSTLVGQHLRVDVGCYAVRPDAMVYESATPTGGLQSVRAARVSIKVVHRLPTFARVAPLPTLLIPAGGVLRGSLRSSDYRTTAIVAEDVRPDGRQLATCAPLHAVSVAQISVTSHAGAVLKRALLGPLRILANGRQGSPARRWAPCVLHSPADLHGRSQPSKAQMRVSLMISPKKQQAAPRLRVRGAALEPGATQPCL